MALLLGPTSASIMMPSYLELGPADPITQCHILEDLNLQHHQNENFDLTYRTCIYVRVMNSPCIWHQFYMGCSFFFFFFCIILKL